MYLSRASYEAYSTCSPLIWTDVAAFQFLLCRSPSTFKWPSRQYPTQLQGAFSSMKSTSISQATFMHQCPCSAKESWPSPMQYHCPVLALQYLHPCSQFPRQESDLGPLFSSAWRKQALSVAPVKFSHEFETRRQLPSPFPQVDVEILSVAMVLCMQMSALLQLCAE